jgi:hypothetical protein
MINFNSFKNNIYFILLYQDTSYNLIEQFGNLNSLIGISVTRLEKGFAE